uniref:Uncharacterized protein n=1 Tax=Arundo donax TaxID=35708 RepID=A0A0A9BJG8_ARUDO
MHRKRVEFTPINRGGGAPWYP